MTDKVELTGIDDELPQWALDDEEDVKPNSPDEGDEVE